MLPTVHGFDKTWVLMVSEAISGVLIISCSSSVIKISATVGARGDPIGMSICL